MLSRQEMAEIERIREALLHHMRSIPPEGEMVNYKNRKFVVHKGVFWMPENAVSLEKWDIRPGDDVLDVGTGSGLIAIIAAAKGAKSVLAVDINPAAVACAKDNAARNGFAHTIEVRQSDVFDAIGNEQFDVITANLPFTKRQAKDVVEAAIYDTSIRTNKRFFSGVGRHLKPGGRLHSCPGNFGVMEEVLQLAEETGFSSSPVGEKQMPKPDPRIFYVFELAQKSRP